MITVIVPVRGETAPGPEFLEPLLSEAVELVVAADARTEGDVLDAYRAAGAGVVTSSGPRGERPREAARLASGEVLLFLHADTVLPAGWLAAVEGALAGGAVGGAFRLAFSGGSRRMAFVAFWANLRTAATGVPYGDQAPFVRRDVYDRLEGHRPWPLLEDVDLFRRLGREGRIALLSPAVRTSPRRYLEGGVFRTVVSNRVLLLRWRLGASPETLARGYRRPPAGGGRQTSLRRCPILAFLAER